MIGVIRAMEPGAMECQAHAEIFLRLYWHASVAR
jgi:hypothetical protein